MIRTFASVLALLSILFVADFAGATKIKSSWKNPKATASSLQFTKVLVVAVIKQPDTRKYAEDRAVQIIEEGGRAHAVASYTILSEKDLQDKEKAKATITGMGFDGAILMTNAGSKDERKYDPENSFQNEDIWQPFSDFWGYYWTAWGSVYNATTTNDLYVYIETMFYSLKENQLIWSAITETKNPKNPAKVVGEIAEEATRALQKEGLLPAKK